MKKIIIICLCLLSRIYVNGQNKIESFTKVIPKHQLDSLTKEVIKLSKPSPPAYLLLIKPLNDSLQLTYIGIFMKDKKTQIRMLSRLNAKKLSYFENSGHIVLVGDFAENSFLKKGPIRTQFTFVTKELDSYDIPYLSSVRIFSYKNMIFNEAEITFH